MINIYDKNAQSFHNDGLGELIDFVEEPEVTTRKDFLECKFAYLMQGVNAEYLKEDYIITMEANPRDGVLPFVIYEAEPDLVSETIYVVARVKIFQELKRRSVPELNFNEADGLSALTIFESNLKTSYAFRKVSDISRRVTFSFEEMNALELLITHESSLMKLLRAEVKVDEDGIRFLNSRGRKRFAYIEKEGSLARKMAITYNTDDVVTSIIPFTTLRSDYVDNEGNRQTRETKVYGNVVNSNATGVPVVTRFVEYRNETTEGKRVQKGDNDRDIELSIYKYETVSQLNEDAKNFFVNNPGISEINTKANLDMLGLAVNEYSEFKNLSIYDTVVFESEKYNIDIELEVVEVVYQPLTQKIVSAKFERASVTFREAQREINSGRISSGVLTDRINQKNQEYNLINYIIKNDGTKVSFVSELPPVEESKEGDVVFLETGEGLEIWKFKEGAWYVDLSKNFERELNEKFQSLQDKTDEMDQQIAESEKKAESAIQAMEEINKKLKDSSETEEMIYNIVGDNGKWVYSDNRLFVDGQQNTDVTSNEVTITLEEREKIFRHNGEGFSIGNDYTFSFANVEFVERPHSAVTIRFREV